MKLELATLISKVVVMNPDVTPVNASPVPLMTREAFAVAVGLPVGVLVAQAERGYWPQITIGRRVFINVEAVRLKAAERAQEFTL